MTTLLSVDVLSDDFSETPCYTLAQTPVVTHRASEGKRPDRPTVRLSKAGEPFNERHWWSKYAGGVPFEDETSREDVHKAFGSFARSQLSEEFTVVTGIGHPYGNPHWADAKLTGELFEKCARTLSRAYVSEFNSALEDNDWNHWAALSLAARLPPAQSGAVDVTYGATWCDSPDDYFVALSDLLSPLAFSSSDEYEDSYGDHIVDWFREEERISCIVSSQVIQVLSYIDETIQEQVFERTILAKRDLIEYLKELLTGLENGNVEADTGD